MYQSILVPLDGSLRAEAILPHVQALAACTGARVILLQVIEPGPIMADPQEMHIRAYFEELGRRTEQARSYLERQREALHASGLRVDTLVVQGSVVESIIAMAGQQDADLIAMASHGRGGLARVFYGSVAAGVLQRIDRPLLLIRAGDE